MPAKAGNAAMTAPNPTMLAVFMTGSTEALVPASMVSRGVARRRRCATSTTMIAASSAVANDQMPPTAASEVGPQRGSARNAVSSRGRTKRLIPRFATITTSIGSAASHRGTPPSKCRPCAISAGSKLPQAAPLAQDTLGSPDESSSPDQVGIGSD